MSFLQTCQWYRVLRRLESQSCYSPTGMRGLNRAQIRRGLVCLVQAQTVHAQIISDRPASGHKLAWSRLQRRSVQCEKQAMKGHRPCDCRCQNSNTSTCTPTQLSGFAVYVKLFNGLEGSVVWRKTAVPLQQHDFWLFSMRPCYGCQEPHLFHFGLLHKGVPISDFTRFPHSCIRNARRNS